MKVKFILISCLLFSIAKSQNTLPDIDSVIKKFYSTYTLSPLSNEYYSTANFEKRQDGWYIALRDLDYKIVNKTRTIFYDAGSEKYLDIDFLPKNINNDTTELNFFNLSDFEKRAFRLQPFYGYTNWFNDVINKYNNIQNTKLSDDELNSLARAYSMYAANLLYNADGFGNSAEMYNLEIKNNCLTDVQISKYDSLCKLATKYFSLLEKQNTNYETMVGNIKIKLANETVVPFHTLLIYANNYSKRYRLPDNLYPQKFIDSVKNTLLSLPKNAVFLSFGDNDFYPVLYLQHHYKVRQDVYLINMSLIGLDRFIYACNQPQFLAKPINIKATKSDYLGNTNDYISLEIENKTILWDNFFKSLEPHFNQIKKLVADKVVINNNLKKVTIKLEKKYLAKNDWVLLDIFNNLNGRKLCYSNGECHSFDFFDATKYCTPIKENLFYLNFDK